MKHNRHNHEMTQPQSVPFRSITPVEETQKEALFSPAPEAVARLAYFSYLNEGARPGRDVQHWLDAEAQLIAERNETRTHTNRHEA